MTDLRGFLAERLPEYMVPAAFVLLPALPLNRNGKMDRQALPAPDVARPELGSAYVPPRTSAEERLASVWSEVLGLVRVGIHDDFFALGGDSILSIQIVARARRSGIRITPRQLFESPTVAELAMVADVTEAAPTEQGTIEGPVPLTPVQSWFWEQELPDPHHFNQSFLFTLREPADHAMLDAAVRRLVVHHDALRLRFEPSGATGWRQVNAGRDGSISLARVCLSALPAQRRTAAMAAAIASLQASLDLARGPLARFVLFELGGGEPDRLFATVHHLAVDGVSWSILLDDLESAYRQLQRGQDIELPEKTTSFKRWAELATAYAASGALDGERAFWLSPARARVGRLPVDGPGDADTVGSARTVDVSLGREETHALLQEVAETYRTRINDALLAGLATGFAAWTGERSLLVELEGHGREELLEGIDLSRTVGWFTSLFPVLLELPESGRPSDALLAVREQLRDVPRHGIGYGLLRYAGGAETGRALRSLPEPEVSFNYVGQLDRVFDRSSFLRPSAEPVDPVRSERGRRRYPLAVNAMVLDGRLHLSFTYGEGRHQRRTIETLAAGCMSALGRLVAECRAVEGAGYASGDFPLARVSQEQLRRLAERVAVAHPGTAGRRAIDDLYAATPMQQGMLFHSLATADPEMYLEQLSCLLRGALEPETLAEAWRRVVQRHPILRTSFAWEGLAEPLQVVHRSVPLAVEQQDWRRLTPAAQEEALAGFLAEDRGQRIDPSTAPLMRLALVRVADDAHRLVWTFHHLLLDGWSLPLVLRDLFDVYGALTRGEEVRLAGSRPFRDYVAWLAGQDRDRAETFWRRALAGLREPTPLPGQRASGREPGVERRREVRVRLAREATAALDVLVRRHRLTAGTVVQGAWALLLGRYTGLDAVAFGVTVSGRPAELEGVEAMVGLFINTLPLVVRMPSSAPLLTWLKRLQEDQIALREFEHSSLVEVQGWSEVPRGLPLFESILVFENYPVEAFRPESGATLEIIAARMVEKTNLPLTLVAVPGPELTLGVSYDPDRIEGAVVERTAVHLLTLLESMTSHADLPLGALDMLPQAERRHLLEERSGAGRAAPAGGPVHELIAARAAADPGALAVMAAGERVTYGELDALSNRLARRLRSLDVGPETLVGLLLERSLDLLVAMLGVLKAGGAYLPLDPDYPRARLDFMLADAGAAVLVTTGRLAAAVGRSGTQVLALDAAREALAAESAMPLPPSVSDDGLAYVIYTSGSTGRPKGVMVRHRSLAAYTATAAERFRLRPGERVLQFASASFDTSAEEIFPCLTRGATLVLRDERMTASAQGFLDRCREWGITVLDLPTSYWHELAVAMERELLGLPESIRLVVIGGEKALASRLDPWRRRVGPEVTLMNTYGPTEATIVTTAWDLGGEAPATIPIGRPIPGAELYVLGADLEPAPVGVKGEIYIGGVGLARGYLGRPDSTAAAFVPHPFAPWPGARLYRTGDLARHLPDGEIEFLGRADGQVKIRGFRIERGEIEAALEAHPAVLEAAVLVRGRDGDVSLTAYVALADGTDLDTDDLRGWLRERLPAYMVPAFWVTLERLPRTANGKLDRVALPDPTARRTDADHTPPRTEIERRLAEIWRELLRVDRVGVHDSFFDLGGHSLLLIQLHGRVREAFGIDASIVDLFRYPDVASFAEYLSLLGAAPSGGLPEDISESAAADIARPAARAAAPGDARAVAIVAMAGRFPGAADVERFWQNISNGIESIAPFSDEELRAAGVAPRMLADPAYVKAGAVLDGIELFDAPFFGYTPREAEILDPQQRLFLECAWEALELAGYAAAGAGERVGVYAGANMSGYLFELQSRPDLVEAVGAYQVMLGNGLDQLAPRVSYKLNLQGPSVGVLTACSTSLVAVHLACRSLLDGECDLALAGGASISVPHREGYLYQEGGIVSPDGHCRAFDARAQGTVKGNGVGVVVLKRLTDALADGDTVRAVIRGSAINNDGSFKIGHTAPSIEGQTRVIRTALERAGLTAADSATSKRTARARRWATPSRSRP